MRRPYSRPRAIEGDQVPVFYRGKLVGHKPGKSDALMVYFLKNHDQRRERVIRQLLAREWRRVMQPGSRTPRLRSRSPATTV